MATNDTGYPVVWDGHGPSADGTHQSVIVQPGEEFPEPAKAPAAKKSADK